MPRNRRFSVRVRQPALCRGELSEIITHLIPKCLRSGWKRQRGIKTFLLVGILDTRLQCFLKKFFKKSFHLYLFQKILCTRTLKVHHFRSIRPRVFYKLGVLKNSAKITRKHLCSSLF